MGHSYLSVGKDESVSSFISRSKPNRIPAEQNRIYRYKKYHTLQRPQDMKKSLKNREKQES
jgi:hypothetical protein